MKGAVEATEKIRGWVSKCECNIVLQVEHTLDHKELASQLGTKIKNDPKDSNY